MIRRVVAAVALLLALATPAASQFISQRIQLQSITTSGTDCTTATNCVTLAGAADIFRTSGVGVQLAGTWVGTAQFEGTLDGTNWTALSVTPIGGGTAVTSATSNGAWIAAPTVLQGARVRASALATPPITVSIIAR